MTIHSFPDGKYELIGEYKSPREMSASLKAKIAKYKRTGRKIREVDASTRYASINNVWAKIE